MTRNKNNYVFFVIGTVVLIIGIVAACMNYNTAHRALVAAEQAQIESKTGDTQKVAGDNAVSKSLESQMKELTGYDAARVRTDDLNAEEFFRGVLTWDNYEQYNENRQDMIEKGVPEDSNFLQVFFPEVRTATDSEGNTYNTLDTGSDALNMSLGNLTTRVIGIDGDVYSYFGEILVTTDTSYKRTDGSEHDIVGTGKCIVTYDMDADGNIMNLDGYIL